MNPSPSCNRCDSGIRVTRIAALDSPTGFIDKAWVCGCVKGTEARTAVAAAFIAPGRITSMTIESSQARPVHVNARIGDPS